MKNVRKHQTRIIPVPVGTKYIYVFQTSKDEVEKRQITDLVCNRYDKQHNKNSPR